MSDIVKIENLKGIVIEINGQNVLLDSDVANIYGVETKRINEAVKELSIIRGKAQQKILMHRSGGLIAEILDDDLQTSDAVTSIELNFAVLKFKHTVKKKRAK